MAVHGTDADGVGHSVHLPDSGQLTLLDPPNTNADEA